MSARNDQRDERTKFIQFIFGRKLEWERSERFKQAMWTHKSDEDEQQNLTDSEKTLEAEKWLNWP